MRLSQGTPDRANPVREPLAANDKLMWLVLIHLTFVVTAFMLTLLLRIAASGKH
jgi:uncharacterized membrane protein YqhA